MSVTVYGKVFEAPRPGAWELDLTHFPRASSKYITEVFLEHFVRGFAEGTKLYGLLLSHIEYCIVNDFLYSMPQGVGAPPGAVGHPPKPIFKLLTWFHPEIRRRLRDSERALQERSWIKDLAYWDNEVKPTAIKEHLAVQRVDPAALATDELVEHLHAAAENAKRGAYRHGRFTITACLPVGDYLAHANAWTGLPAHTLLRPVKGFSAVSNGVAGSEVRELVTQLRATPAAARLLDTEPSSALAQLRDFEGAVGAAARSWLELVSYRIVTGYDVCDRFGLELPEILIGSLRAAISGGEIEAEVAAQATARETAELRERVPAANRTRFDELLADARALYRLRDERDHYNDGWATGLMRRALLEAGRRVADAGRISEPGLFVEASMSEAVALLTAAGGPTNDELAARAAWRALADGSALPQVLGKQPAPPPPAEWLPPHGARLARGVNIFLHSLFQPSEQESTREIVHGIPVSPGVYEGPARVVRGADDFGQVKQGDVLVAPSTSPYFNVLLPLLGAIVTDRGGALSHAAIVAREYGIPGVVGAKVATARIKTGARVRVDGGAGAVHLVGA